jgi:hypothetical protein
MDNYQIFFNENGNAVVMVPMIVPKGQLESYLKWLNEKTRKE